MSINFKNKLNNVSLSDLYGEMKYNKTSLDDRLEVVNNICNTGYFEEYFDNVYDPHPIKTGEMSEDDNVCIFLERMGDYLLLSDEEKQYRKENDVGVFPSRSHLDKKSDREIKFSEILSDCPELNDIILHNMSNKDVNLNANTKLTQEDFERGDNLSDILNSYLSIYNNIHHSNTNNFKKSKLKSDILKDMIAAKEYHTGCSYEFNNLNGEISIDETILDLPLTKEVLDGIMIEVNEQGRKKKVHGLLQKDYVGLDSNNPITYLMHDVEAAIKAAGLTDREQEILNYVRLGYKHTEIADKLGVSRQYINKTYKKILNKIEGVGK